MSDANVLAFPGHPVQSSGADAYRDWLSWAECELSILGFELSASRYDWHAAYKKGLRPEEAAEEAADGFKAG